MERNDKYIDWWKKLNNMRYRRNLTLANASNAGGMDLYYLGFIERGCRPNVQLKTLIQIANGLDIDIKELFNEQD